MLPGWRLAEFEGHTLIAPNKSFIVTGYAVGDTGLAQDYALKMQRRQHAQVRRNTLKLSPMPDMLGRKQRQRQIDGTNFLLHKR